MRKFICVLFLFVFLVQSTIGQIQFTDLNGLEMVENADERKKLLKEWEKANRKYSLSKSPNLLHEGPNTLVFNIVDRNSYFDSSIYYERIYVFDKKTMIAKYAFYNKTGVNKVVHNVRFHKDDIFIFYLTSERVKGTKGFTIRLLCKKNNEPEKYYADYMEKSTRNLVSLSNAYQIQNIVTSSSEKRFLFIESEKGEKAKLSVINNELELETSFNIEFPESKNTGTFVGGLLPNKELVYDIEFDDEKNLVYFINEEGKNKKEKSMFVDLMVYDMKTKKLTEITIDYDYEDLGLYIKKEAGVYKKPLINYMIKNNYLYIYGVTEPKEKSKSKYKDVEREVVLNKISLDTKEIVETSKSSVPEELFVILKESKSYFHKKSDLRSILMEKDDDNIKYIKIDYYTSQDNGDGSNVSFEVGGILFPVESDKIQEPIAVPCMYKSRPLFYSNGKNYLLRSEKEAKTYSLVEIKDNQERIIFTTKSEGSIFLLKRLDIGDEFVLFKSENGLVRVDLVEKK